MKKLFLIALTLTSFVSAAQAAETENAYERVMRTGVIRCAYILWPPFMDKDVNTGKFSGMNYDFIEAVAKGLDMKVEWTAEINPGEVESLRTGKADAICTAEGPIKPSSSRFLHYTEAMGYFPFFLYARSDDARFSSYSKVNDKAVRISVIDGDVSGQIVRNHFPLAQQISLQQMGTPGQMMLDVAGNKSDVVINDPLSMKEFMDNNPGKLKRVAGEKPIAVIPNTFSVLRGPGGLELTDLLNQAIKNLRNYGEAALILDKYSSGGDNLLYPIADPYEVKQ